MMRKFLILNYTEVNPYQRFKTEDERSMHFYEAVKKFMNFKFINSSKSQKCSIRDIIR